MGEKYSQILETLEKLKSLAPEPYNNFNDIDTFLHIIAAEPEGEDALRRIIKEVRVAEQFEISEKTLQELLEKTLTKLLPGFSIYEDEESRGVEYPTSVGRIDVLAINEKDKEMLVIELKSGIASTDALKILSYMQWVEENLAEGRKVKGLIIALDMDDKLKYALRRIPDVQFKKFRIDIKLE
jgi:RecB family endonuclease NucS